MRNNISFIVFLAFLSLRIQSQTITDFDGNVYNTIAIGTQIWMKENLKTTHYRNGLLIPNVSGATQWYNLFNTGTGARCYYNNDSAVNVATYGALYNWHAAHSGSNLCPANWHVPTDTEWSILTDYLYNNGYAYQGSGFDIAKSMAAETGWTTSATPGNVGNDQSSNDSTSFSAIPGGIRSEYGTYNNLLNIAYWWSSTTDDIFHAWSRIMQYNSAFVSRNAITKEVGASGRCICDFLTTEIQEINNDIELNIYPNPTSGIINIVFDNPKKDTRIEAINPYGQVIISKHLSAQYYTIIDLSNYSKGLYLVRVMTGDKVAIRKVLVE